MNKADFQKKIKEKALTHKEYFQKFTVEEKKEIESRVHYYEMLMALRQLRKKLGLTQAQLAEQAALPRTTLTKIESGTHNPTIATLNQIARALNKKLVIRFE